MKFYHGTSEDSWKKIQDSGELYGLTSSYKKDPNKGYRYTYLSPHIEIAEAYGPVLLEVEYSPVGIHSSEGLGIDNYGFLPPPDMTCWQFSVFNSIPIEKVRRVTWKK